MPYNELNEKLVSPSAVSDPLMDKIKREFVARRQKNPSYSQRAYAKFLGLDQSLLSKVLNGQWALSQSLRMKVGLKLGMSPLELELEDSISSAAEQKKQKNLKDQFKKIEEEFQFLSNWYSFAILEYLKIPGVSCEPAPIAKAFGIQTFEVQDTLERLVHFNFIEKSEDGFKLKSPNNLWSDTMVTSLARQLLQKKLVEKSLVAIEEMSFAHRYHSSLTVAVDQSRLPEFKKKIEEIQMELSEFFQPSGRDAETVSVRDQANGQNRLSEVYQLQIGFFPLTINNKFNKQENKNEK